MSVARAPLPEIKEADATGPVADLYADIRATIGVTMVNLIFRHMATVPGCLEWAWAHLKPLYANGLIEKAADRILASSDLDHVVSFDPSSVAATGASVDAVAAVGRSYARANPMNLLGLDVLKDLLEETDVQRTARPDPATLGAGPISQNSALTQNHPMPPMVDLNAVPVAVRRQLDMLARQLHQGDNGVIPSLYRHLAHWPAMLDLIYARLAPTVESGAVFTAADALRTSARAAGDDLYRACPRIEFARPRGAVADTLRALIITFPDNICRMTLVARALARLSS